MDVFAQCIILLVPGSHSSQAMNLTQSFAGHSVTKNMDKLTLPQKGISVLRSECKLFICNEITQNH